jgi:hypothetical protein
MPPIKLALLGILLDMRIPTDVSCSFASAFDPHVELLRSKSPWSESDKESWTTYTQVYEKFRIEAYDGHVPENGMLFSFSARFDGVAVDSSRYTMFAHSSDLQTKEKRQLIHQMILNLANDYSAPMSVHTWCESHVLCFRRSALTSNNPQVHQDIFCTT